MAEWLMSGSHFLLSSFTDPNGEPQYRRNAANLLRPRGPNGRSLLTEQHGLLTRYSLQLAREFPEVFCRSALLLHSRAPGLFAALHRYSDDRLLIPDRYRVYIHSCNVVGKEELPFLTSTTRPFKPDMAVDKSEAPKSAKGIKARGRKALVTIPADVPFRSDYVNAVHFDSIHFQNEYDDFKLRVNHP